MENQDKRDTTEVKVLLRGEYPGSTRELRTPTVGQTILRVVLLKERGQVVYRVLTQ